MRTFVTVGLVVLAALAGCTGRTLDCPDEYGQQFEDVYRTVAEKLDDAGTPIPDADYDCVSDPLEAQIGTDPEDGASYPTMEQLAEVAQNLPGLGNGTAPPPPPAFVWKATTIDGDFTTTVAYDPDTTRTFTVPADAQALWLNLTSTGSLPGGLNVRFIPAGCAASDCYLDASAPDGTLSYESKELSAGEWRLVLFARGVAQEGTYELEANALVPAPETVVAVAA